MTTTLMTLLLSVSTATGGTIFQIDSARSDIAARLYKAGIGSAFAHNHIVDAPEIEGFASVDADKQMVSSVKVTVDATALVADRPDLRRTFGLDTGMDEDTRQEIQSTMLGETQLDVRRYPEITFAADEVEKTPDGRYLARGKLSLHGHTEPMTVPLRVEWTQLGVRVQGRFEVKQTTFGIEPYSAGFGAVRNEDRVTVYLDLFLKPGRVQSSPEERGQPT